MVLNRILAALLTSLLMLAGTRAQDQVSRLEAGIVFLPGITHSGGFEPGMNGTALKLSYLHPLKSSGLLKGGLETGFTGWGGQALFAAGYRTPGMHALEGSVLNGMAFYRQGPAWVGGLQLSYVGTFFRGKKNALAVSAGLRFSMQPAYREYGPLWYYFDLPLRISWVRLRI